MKWIEASQLPTACKNCVEEDCYNCDHAGNRWQLSQKDALLLRRKGLLRAVARLQQQLYAVEQELQALEHTTE